MRAVPTAALMLLALGTPAAAGPPTTTPIEHLIVVVGENLGTSVANWELQHYFLPTDDQDE